MKHKISALLLSVGIIACNQQATHSDQLQTQINELKKQVENGYKPGFGEFMSSIQVHHSKLWFAGENENWKLADFEVAEIKESLDDLQKYCSDRSESQSIPMLYPALDSVIYAISTKNKVAFENSFIFLTNTCNTCHQETNHEFNVIKIPTSPPFSNQEFTPKN